MGGSEEGDTQKYDFSCGTRTRAFAAHTPSGLQSLTHSFAALLPTRGLLDAPLSLSLSVFLAASVKISLFLTQNWILFLQHLCPEDDVIIRYGCDLEKPKKKKLVLQCRKCCLEKGPQIRKTKNQIIIENLKS